MAGGMDQAYEAFTLADPLFFDVLHAGRGSGASFGIAGRRLPAGWRRHERDDWLVFAAGRSDLPAQGWKIHASATLDNAERVLAAVWDYCVPRGIDFKTLRSPAILRARVAKYAPRGYSGKLATIYPAGDAACETILNELGEILAGEPSPYILSDLRWGDGPLYVRYGGFSDRYHVDDAGELVPAIADPAGNLVPDRRGPVFTVPSWVPLPAFLAPHLAARNAVTVADLPYAVERVLHFSNGGGIYLASDRRTGGRAVLKEGRPHAGLDAWNQDAVHRVEHEHAMLRRLAGIDGVPAVHDLFWLGEHRFLAMEYVAGEMLSRAIVRRYPLIDAAAGPAGFDAYTHWALDIHRRVEAAVTAVHRRGVVYGDLHLFNVMVRPDDTVTLLDFEVATAAGDTTRPGLGNQGFAAPPGTTGTDIDAYALACLRLALFLPITNLLRLHRPKARHFAEIIAEHFPVPPAFLAEAVDVIAPGEPSLTGPAPIPAQRTSPAPATPPLPSSQLGYRFHPDPMHWPPLRDQLARAIVASATPERDDRLFPGDVQQFTTGAVGLAYGAAGVLYALSVTGCGRYPRFEQWLLDHATAPPAGVRLGLYDGLHGAAFALDHLDPVDHRQAALDILDVCLRERWESLGVDLAGGLAGIGLNLLHFADRTGEPVLHAAALRAVELVAERITDQNDQNDQAHEPGGNGAPLVSGGRHRYAGLMRGWAGAALLLLRGYDVTGDTALLDRAAVALRADLRRCLLRDGGVLEVNEGWRTMPYLDVGSVGIGVVLDEYLARRHDDRFAEASRGIEGAARAGLYVFPGLFSGRAGILLYLAGRSPAPADEPLVAQHVGRLAWHALPYCGGLAFPGTNLLRLTMDLATGTAGVLLALGAALHDQGSQDGLDAQQVHAPLLTPSRRPMASSPLTPAPTGSGPFTVK